MSLPKELEVKRDELSYSYEGPNHRNCMGCCQSDSDYQKTFEHGFNAGVSERDKYLANLGDEFDEKAVKAYTSGEYADHFEDGEEEALAKKCFYLGARWQHEQSKLKHHSHLQMLRDHVKEDSNEIVKLNNIIHKQQAIIETLKEQRNDFIHTLYEERGHTQKNQTNAMIKHLDKELAELEQGKA